MFRLMLVSVLGLFVVGCGGGVRAPLEGRADPFVPAQVHFDSKALQRDTAVGTPIARRDQAGLLVVTVPFRSAINKTLYVDYYVTFFDERGTPVAPKMGPFNKTLQANTPDSITVTSLTPRAADFQIDFRYAR
jgi:uncharacterized protein YcfL